MMTGIFEFEYSIICFYQTIVNFGKEKTFWWNSTPGLWMPTFISTFFIVRVVGFEYSTPRADFIFDSIWRGASKNKAIREKLESRWGQGIRERIRFIFSARDRQDWGGQVIRSMTMMDDFISSGSNLILRRSVTFEIEDFNSSTNVWLYIYRSLTSTSGKLERKCTDEWMIPWRRCKTHFESDLRIIMLILKHLPWGYGTTQTIFKYICFPFLVVKSLDFENIVAETSSQRQTNRASQSNSNCNFIQLCQFGLTIWSTCRLTDGIICK